MPQNIELSIVIPSKNEESHIASCLDSLIKHTASFSGKEIILVDCASTDATLRIAEGFPIKILQLQPEWVHTASAARSIGGLFAKGEFIFFIDSDMTLKPHFLEEAIEELRKDTTIAAIGGIGQECYYQDGKEAGSKENLYNTSAKVTQVEFLGGTAVYRRKALTEVHGFNPYLSACEERELAQRLRAKHYRLITLPIPMVTHHTAFVPDWDEFLRKRKMKLFTGIGQALRLSHSFLFFYESLRYYKEFSLFLLVCMYLCVILVLSWHKISLGYLPFFFPFLLLYCLLCLKKKDARLAAVGLLKWMIISADIVKGLFTRTNDTASYPTNPHIIKGDFDARS